MLRLQDIPYNAIVEMKSIEEALRLKEELGNFEITKTSRITTSFVSGKLFGMRSSPKPAKLQIDRKIQLF